MANRNTVGFGLIPTGTVGATPATAGQGKYFIDAAYDKDLFQGTVVQSKVGYIKAAEATRTLLTIGILNGIFYNAATTLKPTFDNKYIQPITPANSDANIHDTNNQFRLLRSAEDPENDENAANRSVVVCQNLNQYMQNTGTAGITWQ